MTNKSPQEETPLDVSGRAAVISSARRLPGHTATSRSAGAGLTNILWSNIQAGACQSCAQEVENQLSRRASRALMEMFRSGPRAARLLRRQETQKKGGQLRTNAGGIR